MLLSRLGAAIVLPLVLSSVVSVSAKPLVYHVVTDEISAKQPDGSKVEVYRFDPAIYVVHQGDDVVLSIRGVKGHDHPVVVEGYPAQGVVHKNQETKLRFIADKVGMFNVVCTAHADAAHNGPMEGYLVVLPKV